MTKIAWSIGAALATAATFWALTFVGDAAIARADAHGDQRWTRTVAFEEYVQKQVDSETARELRELDRLIADLQYRIGHDASPEDRGRFQAQLEELERQKAEILKAAQ